MRHLAPCCALLAGLPAALLAFDQDNSTNETFRRESFAIIPTIYGDLRRDVGGVPCGYPLPHWTGSLSIDWEDYQVIRENTSPIVTRPSDPVVPNPNRYEPESRQDITVTYRQSFGISFTSLEIVARGARSVNAHDSELYAWGDLSTRLLFPLFTNRYSAMTLVVGVDNPTGNRHDWEISHGSWAPEAGLRSSTGLDFFVLSMSALASYCPFGKNDIHDPQVNIIPDRTMIGDGGACLTYRVCSGFRFGAAQRITYREYRGRGDALGLDHDRAIQAPTVGVIEATPWRNYHFAGEFGKDFLANKAYPRDRDRWVFGAGLTTTF